MSVPFLVVVEPGEGAATLLNATLSHRLLQVDAAVSVADC